LDRKETQMRSIRRKAGVLSLLATAVAVFAPAPSASAEVLTRTQSTDIAIPSSGNATPYPSSLFVQEADGPIQDVNVQLTLNHTFPDDVDIVLVSPEGDAQILMSDACGSDTMAEDVMSFDDEAATAVSDGGPCNSGNFKPANYGGDDTFGAPGPGTVSSASLASFDGEDPNGTWKLFVVDDVIALSGSITSWSITITTETAEVIIPGTGTSGRAAPYPSAKTFNTPAGKVIGDVDFATSFSHTFADDVDMLLVGPQGQTTFLMSSACGGATLHRFSWVFDDEAATALPDEGPCSPGSFKPSVFGTPP
jgi:subtilisin-like proprotein convertase family protein